MRRDEEGRFAEELADGELLFRLRQIVRYGNNADSALFRAVADGRLTRVRADALRAVLEKEGLVPRRKNPTA